MRRAGTDGDYDRGERLVNWEIQGGEVLTDGAVGAASVFVADGVVVATRPAAARPLDASGMLVLPGIVDVHGDGFERQIMPRAAGVVPARPGLARDGPAARRQRHHDRVPRPDGVVGAGAAQPRQRRCVRCGLAAPPRRPGLRHPAASALGDVRAGRRRPGDGVAGARADPDPGVQRPHHQHGREGHDRQGPEPDGRALGARRSRVPGPAGRGVGAPRRSAGGDRSARCRGAAGRRGHAGARRAFAGRARALSGARRARLGVSDDAGDGPGRAYGRRAHDPRRAQRRAWRQPLRRPRCRGGGRRRPVQRADDGLLLPGAAARRVHAGRRRADGPGGGVGPWSRATRRPPRGWTTAARSRRAGAPI